MLQTMFKGVKRFVKLLKPFLLEDFLQNGKGFINVPVLFFELNEFFFVSCALSPLPSLLYNRTH